MPSSCFIQGGTLKPWPELVEGLFGGGLIAILKRLKQQLADDDFHRAKLVSRMDLKAKLA